MKAWGGRFSEAPDALAADFGRSIDIDAEMALDDLSEVEVPLSRKEITALMRPEMRRWLGW